MSAYRTVAASALFLFAISTSSVPAEDKKARQEKVVEQFDLWVKKGLHHGEFLAELADKKDYEALTAICNQPYWPHCEAGLYLAQALPADSVLDFVKKCPVGSGLWMAAIRGLRNKPKEAIIEYLIWTVQQEEPAAKFAAYDLCERRGWSELARYARIDQHSEAAYIYANGGYKGIGETAKKYLTNVVDRTKD